jgi:integrase
MAEDPARANASSAIPTFGQAVVAYHAAHAAKWKSEKDFKQWLATMVQHCPSIWVKAVNEIDTVSVLKVVKPIWLRIPTTASQVRGRIEAVLDAACALGHIEEDKANPARWKGHLSNLLPIPTKIGEQRHHAAVSYRDVPDLMRALQKAAGVSPQALAFTILTGARTGETLGARWDEIDWDAKTWTVPVARMKGNVEHTVALSDAALAILEARWKARRGRHEFVFPGRGQKAHLSTIAMQLVMRRLAKGFTVHGFRSSFRDWAADHGVEFEVAEACLAHAVGNAVTRAYLRSTMIERRRKVMTDWAAFLAGEGEAKLIQFKTQRR